MVPIAELFSRWIRSRDFTIAFYGPNWNAKMISRLQHANCRLLKNREGLISIPRYQQKPQRF